MAIAVGFVGLSLAALIVVQPLWLITLVMLGRGGFFSAWSLFIAALGDVVEEPLRARTFALSEMCGGTAVALAPMLAGLMYTRQPIWPLLAASVLAALLIPVLLGTQRFVNSHRVSGAFVQTDPEPG
jgi:MFS family permease